MKLRHFRESEEGSVAIIVALSLTVLLGFTAFAVDFGMMASVRQHLQNAADAAALAGAADLGAGKPLSDVNATVDEYCRANGVDGSSDNIRIDVFTLDKTCTVTIHRTMQMGFSAVLSGKYERDVGATATAEAVSIFGACPYSMFAGRRIEDDGLGISVSGNDIQINGNIHSNADISMPNAVLSPGSVATAVHDVRPSGSGWNGGSIAQDMPSFRSFESALNGMYGTVEFYGDVVKNAEDGFQELLDESQEMYWSMTGGDGYYYDGLYIHIYGDLIFNGNESSVYSADFPIVLVVDGDVKLNGACLGSGTDCPCCIMSKNGNITVNGGGATYTGILYAPNGDVTINGNDAEFVGSIVGQNIRKAGGKISVSYYEDADRFLPKTKVHLIA